MPSKLKWMIEADRYLGLKEVPGKASNPTIVGWLNQLKAWWAEDATPWCGTYVAHCLSSAGIELPKDWYRAKAWASWGQPLFNPVAGCVVVFEREGGGHVGFVVGKDSAGNLLVQGGNQGDQVNIRAFPVSRVLAYRWPSSVPVTCAEVPVVVAGAKVSTSEA